MSSPIIKQKVLNAISNAVFLFKFVGLEIKGMNIIILVSKKILWGLNQ